MNTSVFNQALKREQEELQAKLRTLGALDYTVIGDWVSTPEEAITTESDDNVAADRAEAATERDGELAVFETRLSLVSRALEKIKNGTFGNCEICNTPIEVDRLMVNAAARTCKTHLDDERDLAN